MLILTVKAGMTGCAACMGVGSASPSRPCFVNTNRRSMSWHSEHCESMVLKAGDTHDIVLGHVNQDHFTAARHTTHRTHSY